MIWKKAINVVTQSVVGGNPSDEVLALYLEVDDEYRVTNLKEQHFSLFRHFKNINIKHTHFQDWKRNSFREIHVRVSTIYSNGY